MSINPFPFNPTRDSSAIAPLDLPVAGSRAVTAVKGHARAGEDDEAQSRQSGHGASQDRPRDERERDAQRQALSSLILGVFGDGSERPSAKVQPGPSAVPADARAPAAALQQDPQLEAAIFEFMNSLFQALDQIDDAEPMLELAALPGGLGSPIGRTGRSAFGSRLDLLARRFSAEPTFPLTFADPVAPGFEGIEPRLAQSYSVLLRVIHGDSSFERSIQRPRAHLAALIARLANAMHVAPALGYGTNTRTGAMLRVRA